MNIRRTIQLAWALALATALWAGAAGAAHVVSTSGEVERGRGEPAAWSALETGDALDPGDRVRTGEDGKAELQLGRVTVRLYPDSVLRLPLAAEPGESDSVSLEEGVSLFDVRPAPRSFEVRTPEVVVSVKGTRFSVALAGEAAAVAVYRGSVGVRNMALSAARETLVREGFGATGSDRFQLDLLDGPDPWEAFETRALEEVWQPEVALAAPASAAAADAKAMAHSVSRAEAVAHAAERHPEVRQRMEKIQKKREKAQRGRDTDESDRMNERAEAMLAKRDGVSDVDELMDNVGEEFVETWMNGGVPGGPQFDVSFVDGSGMSGPDHVFIDGPGTLEWTFEEDDIEDVLDGEASLPSNLVGILNSQGITDPQVFAQQLLTLFDD